MKRRILTKECQLQQLTKRQVWGNRQLLDQKAQRDFLEKANGPSKFTGKRGGDDVKLEELKLVTPVGVQWTCRASGEEGWEAARDAWTEKLQARWPEAEIRRVTGSWRTLRIEAEDMVALRNATR